VPFVPGAGALFFLYSAAAFKMSPPSGPARWFAKDDAFDNDFRDRFADPHEAATDGRLDDWADSADGCLAQFILLDQYFCNSFCDTARAFATDDAARALADAAIARGVDRVGH